MVYGIIMIVAGLLAAPQLIAGKSKSAEDLLKKMAPYQGWFGLVLFVWGVWGIISSVLNLAWLTATPIWWITYLAMALLETALGLLLGFNLIDQYILSKNPTSAAKGKELHAKLVPKQKLFGILGIIAGLWTIVFWLFIYNMLYSVM